MGQWSKRTEFDDQIQEFTPTLLTKEEGKGEKGKTCWHVCAMLSLMIIILGLLEPTLNNFLVVNYTHS